MTTSLYDYAYIHQSLAGKKRLHFEQAQVFFGNL